VNDRIHTCSDCGGGWLRPVTSGPRPKRCPPCWQIWRRRRNTEIARERKDRRTARPTVETLTCGLCAEKWDRARRNGGKPKLCPSCEQDNKWCGPCQQAHPNADFSRDVSTRTGYSKTCRGHDSRSAKGRLAKNPVAARDAVLRRKYGLSADDWHDLLVAQRGACAICGTTTAGGPGFHVDHCHTTGKIRGLLCGPCNTGIGQLKDDPDVIRAAAAYVERHRTNTYNRCPSGGAEPLSPEKERA
jgi:hypothetical protein